MDELATHADAVHVSTGYSVLPSPPIPTGRQVQGVAGALALAGAVKGGFGDEVGREVPVRRRLDGERRATQAVASSRT